VITAALNKIPPALDVLIRERPKITSALEKLGTFSDTATRLVNDSKADLVKNLENLVPTFQALADIGPGIDDALGWATVFPYGQGLIDRGLRGDFMNLYAIVDLTVTRLRKTLLLGTRWGLAGAQLVPAPGDSGYDAYYRTNPGNPLIAVPPQGAGPPPRMGAGNVGVAPWEAPPPPQPSGPEGPTPFGQGNTAPPPYWDELGVPGAPPPANTAPPPESTNLGLPLFQGQAPPPSARGPYPAENQSVTLVAPPFAPQDEGSG
jgi:phospholipid/cholesterol/gamma-HCH transport system substrate-binding protein